MENSSLLDSLHGDENKSEEYFFIERPLDSSITSQVLLVVFVNSHEMMMMMMMILQSHTHRMSGETRQ